jgi:4,5-dihydroxyphthalate decarboxylase
MHGVPTIHPPGWDITVNQTGKSLSQLIDAGELDATIGTHLPDSRKTNPDVQRIFPNFREVERDYYKKTGIFPVMHLIAIKREVYEKNPFIAKSLYDAFEKAKRAALVRMRNYSALRYMLPWLPDEIDEMERVFGDDQWTYGLEANRSTFETMMKFMVQQDMLKKAPTVEELFVKVD